MRKLIVLALTISAITGSASAEPRHWYKDPKWWVGEAVIVGATMADANSTCRGLQRGGTEQNVILGPHPGCGHVYALEASALASYTALHALEWRLVIGDEPDPKLGWRMFGYASVPVVVLAIHGSAAIRNYSDAGRTPPNTATGTAIRIGHQEEVRTEFSSRVGEGLVR